MVTNVVNAPADDTPAPGSSIYLYSPGVRIWHWATVLSIVGLSITGYLIGTPPTSIQGEASNSFYFGYIRTIHFALGYVLAIGLLWRTLKAIISRGHSAHVFYVPVWSARFRADLMKMFKWYALQIREPMRWNGHNPMARLTMMVLFVWTAFFMVFTGLALYAEGVGLKSWQEMMFGWVRALVGGSMELHTLHHLGMYVILVFFMLHLYSVIRDDIMGRTGTLSSMFSGWRAYRERR